MRDTYDHNGLPAELNKDPGPQPGMRHSIRPRNAVVVAGDPTDADYDKQTKLNIVSANPPAQGTQIEAIEKMFLTEPDLPRWHELSLVQTGTRRKSKSALPVVDNARDSASVRAFDQLRTRLRQTTQEHGWTNIAISAPTSGCGTTFAAVNLALSLSRVAGSKTTLMDFNLRKPGVGQAFDMHPRGAMQDFLSGQSPIGDHMVRVSETLALGLNNAPDQNSAETLQAGSTAHTLERMRAALQPELVIYDMPPMLAQDDVSAFLPQLDGVLLVSDGTQTTAKQLMECERLLENQVPLLGVILNKARANSIQKYA